LLSLIVLGTRSYWEEILFTTRIPFSPSCNRCNCVYSKARSNLFKAFSRQLRMSCFPSWVMGPSKFRRTTQQRLKALCTLCKQSHMCSGSEAMNPVVQSCSRDWASMTMGKPLSCSLSGEPTRREKVLCLNTRHTPDFWLCES